MKLKAKITGANFPAEIQGTVVDVSVQAVLINGVYWSVGISGYEIEQLGDAIPTNGPSLIGAIGTKPQKITIDF